MRNYGQYMPLASAYMRKAGLSWQEKCTCILVHLDYSTNDIAMLLETSGPRISNAKRNANRKLFGDEEGQWLRKRLVEIESEGEELNL